MKIRVSYTVDVSPKEARRLAARARELGYSAALLTGKAEQRYLVGRILTDIGRSEIGKDDKANPDEHPTCWDCGAEISPDDEAYWTGFNQCRACDSE